MKLNKTISITRAVLCAAAIFILPPAQGSLTRLLPSVQQATQAAHLPRTLGVAARLAKNVHIESIAQHPKPTFPKRAKNAAISLAKGTVKAGFFGTCLALDFVRESCDVSNIQHLLIDAAERQRTLAEKYPHEALVRVLLASTLDETPTQKEFEWSFEASQAFIDSELPDSLLLDLLFRKPTLFSEKQQFELINRNINTILKKDYLTNLSIRSARLGLSENARDLLIDEICKKKSADVVAHYLLFNPDFFPEKTYATLLETYAQAVVEQLERPPVIAVDYIRPLFKQEKHKDIVARFVMTHCSFTFCASLLFTIPTLFAEEQQRDILKGDAKTLLREITGKTLNILQPHNCLKEAVAHLITESAPDETACFYLSLNPGFFSEEQQCTLIKKNKFSALPDLHLHFSELMRQESLMPKARALLIKLMPEEEVFNYLIEKPELFSNQEQQDLIIKYKASKNEKTLLALLFQAPHFFSEAEQTNLITIHPDLPFLELMKQESLMPKARALLIELMPAEKVFNYLIEKPELFSNQEQQDLIIKYKASKNEKTLLALLFQAPHFFSEAEQTNLITIHADDIINLFITDHNLLWNVDKQCEPIKSLLSDLLIEKAPDELFQQLYKNNGWGRFSNWLSILFSKEQQDTILKKIRQLYGDPFTQEEAAGPLFSSYLEKNPENLSKLLSSSQHRPHFYNLLSTLSDYVKTEYKKDNIVFFHGQKADWILLEKIYRKLLALQTGIASPEDFKHLRFYEHSSLLEEQLPTLLEKGAKYEFGYKQSADESLFTTLNPFANNEGSNSYHYAINNHDSSDQDAFQKALVHLFENAGLKKEYEQLPPAIFSDLHHLFTQAVQEQGNHGQLLVISMPKELARKLSYSAHGNARPMPLLINDHHTTDTVEIAENYDHVPFHNAFVVLLSEEIINREAAQKAGVKIVGFDPVAYWNTEKWQHVEKQLETIIELIKKEKESKGGSDETK